MFIGLSSALSGDEDQLIRNNIVRMEIEMLVGEVFGISYLPPSKDAYDPFASDKDCTANYEDDVYFSGNTNKTHLRYTRMHNISYYTSQSGIWRVTS